MSLENKICYLSREHQSPGHQEIATPFFLNPNIGQVQIFISTNKNVLPVEN